MVISMLVFLKEGLKIFRREQCYVLTWVWQISLVCPNGNNTDQLLLDSAVLVETFCQTQMEPFEFDFLDVICFLYTSYDIFIIRNIWYCNYWIHFMISKISHIRNANWFILTWWYRTICGHNITMHFFVISRIILFS